MIMSAAPDLLVCTATLSPSDLGLFINALNYAADKHRDQRRKDPEASPYINHPIKVAHILWTVGGVQDSVLLTAALLHDALEDTTATPEELHDLFGDAVLNLVEEVTDDKKLSKVQRKRLQIEHALNCSPHAKQLKIADKIANVTDIIHSPPRHWSLKRRYEYVRWSQQVVAGLRGVNPALEQHYDELAEYALSVLNREEQTVPLLQIGDRVYHSRHSLWDVGQVLYCTPDQQLQIFFVGVGIKRVRRLNQYLVKLESDDARHPLLDNLKQVKRSEDLYDYHNIAELSEYFLSLYPEGFYAEEYINEYRTPQINAHQLMTTTLNQSEFARLLSMEDYRQIAHHALDIMNRGIPIKHHQALATGLAQPQHQACFAQKLYDLLYDGNTPRKQHFQAFIECLGQFDAAHWDLATYYLFCNDPDNDMLLHPHITPHAADLCAFELHYDVQPNWRTYERLASFAHYLRTLLVDLRPQDMYDIYAFMREIVLKKPL